MWREETGPGVSLVANQLQGPKLGLRRPTWTQGPTFLAGDLGQVRFHL